MFTIKEIELAHDKVKSGADFPRYIQEIKAMGVERFETWVKDSHTEYFGNGHHETSLAMYDDLSISKNVDKEEFTRLLKNHQKGETDYFQFCKDCAETGIEKWIVDLHQFTCIYYDQKGNVILKEEIPN